ncbi:hypothetical protein [Streptomyces sp. NPDC055134]
MTENGLRFHAEVRVVTFPSKPEFEGMLGAILEISGPRDADAPVSYGVMLDDDDRLVSFSREQIEPTGRDRKREDHY